MNNKGVGAIFGIIAAILFSIRYIAAAIYVNGAPTISAEVFGAALTSVGSGLLIAAIVAAALCLCFLAVGFVKDGKKD